MSLIIEPKSAIPHPEERTISRRDALRYLIGGAMAVFSAGYAEYGFAVDDGNFKHIYLNPKLREQFFLFLKNVFNLYPEDALHDLIFSKVQKLTSDKEIYQAILSEIPGIKPRLAEIRYALPSLKKQKEVMCEQTIQLLDGKMRFGKYVEIGSTGRYYDKLKDKVRFDEKPTFINSDKPTFGPTDIIERGQLRQMGDFVPLYEYQPITGENISDESVDLMTVYIGFHHAPPKRRDDFIASCRRVLKKGGLLIVRDHDVDSESMVHFVALAHDVFNVGFELPWEQNSKEIRNFTSLTQLEALLKNAGFVKHEQRLLQEGDPTRNTLMRFAKT